MHACMPAAAAASRPQLLAAGANSDVTMSDLRGPGKHPHPLAVKPETWQEVGGLAHFAVVPSGCMLGSQHPQG
jgi:hypothetical protein